MLNKLSILDVMMSCPKTFEELFSILNIEEINRP